MTQLIWRAMRTPRIVHPRIQKIMIREKIVKSQNANMNLCYKNRQKNFANIIRRKLHTNTITTPRKNDDDDDNEIIFAFIAGMVTSCIGICAGNICIHWDSTVA